MIEIGLTGSIAMGKSTVAQLFVEEGVPVHDSDIAVKELYQNPAVIKKIVKAFPDFANSDNSINKDALASHIFKNTNSKKMLEAVLHPLVRNSQSVFRERCVRRGCPIVLFDIPLLFETNRVKNFDVIIVVTASAKTQKKRALLRKGMTEEKFEQIRTLQIPDSQKREQADYIIDTDKELAFSKQRVRYILQEIKNTKD